MKSAKAIFSILSNDAAVAAIASTRIFPVVTSKNAVMPFVTYDILNVVPDDTKTGIAKIDNVDLECVCHAETYSAASNLGDAVRTALDRSNVALSDVTIDSIQFQSGNIELTETPRKFMVVLEFKIRERRT